MIFFYFTYIFYKCQNKTNEKNLSSKIPKRKISTASSKLTNKMRVSSSLAIQALNGAGKSRITPKRNNSSSCNSKFTPNANQSKECRENGSRTKVFNHSQLQPLSASTPPNGTSLAISEKNQHTRRLLDFIQAQKATAKDRRPALMDNITNGKIYSQPQKAINGHQRDGVRNGCIENSRKKSQIEMKTRAGDNPFVPSKRLIQHHDYQNLVDDSKAARATAAAAKTTITAATPSIPVQSNRNRYDNCTYDSVHNTKGLVDKNNNRKYNDNERTKAPIYRHFGDTNLLRSKGKQSPTHNNAMNNNNNNMNNNICGSSISLATTEPSLATFDKYQKAIKCSAYPDGQRSNADNLQLAQRIDAFPVVSTSHLTNDTGFGSMDAASIVTPQAKSKANNNSKSNNFHMPFQCVNYNVKNRIKMFDVDPSAYRKHAANNDKR